MYGQPGSESHPHTSINTQDHLIDDGIPPSSLDNSHIHTTNPSHIFLSSCTTNTNDLSSWNFATGLLRPLSKLRVGDFNVRTMCQIGQQASLARTLESQVIVRMDFNRHSLLQCSIKLNSKNLKIWWHVVSLSLYLSKLSLIITWKKLKMNFMLSNLGQKSKLSDLVIVAVNYNVQVAQMKQTERHLGGSYVVVAQRTDYGDRLLQLCTDNRLILSNSSFKHKEKHHPMWWWT